jgi:hypothetical protein
MHWLVEQDLQPFLQNKNIWFAGKSRKHNRAHLINHVSSHTLAGVIDLRNDLWNTALPAQDEE